MISIFGKVAFDAITYYFLRGSAPKKYNFLVKIFQKVPKNAFWPVFKLKLAALKLLSKYGYF